ncbi:MAG TPA: hypothetical protein VE569_07710 [Acidimicrobiia bacterium]|nr:hypothetical protein [Acidimicrobiia bacterium]
MSRGVLRKVDNALRAEFDQEQGEWMAKVPISGATKVVWQRYCQAVGVGMGEGVALLMLHELAPVAGEDAERLADRLHTQEAKVKARAQALNDQEKNLNKREHSLSLREADLEDRQTEVAAREHHVAAIEQSLAQRLRAPGRYQTAGSSTPKLGRNERTCHLGSDQSR